MPDIERTTMEKKKSESLIIKEIDNSKTKIYPLNEETDKPR